MAVVTSLPELVTTLAAIKIGAEDMAIGNLFGSNLFNMFAIGLTDLFYTQGRFLAVIDPSFVLIGSDWSDHDLSGIDRKLGKIRKTDLVY